MRERDARSRCLSQLSTPHLSTPLRHQGGVLPVNPVNPLQTLGLCDSKALGEPLQAVRENDNTIACRNARSRMVFPGGSRLAICSIVSHKRTSSWLWKASNTSEGTAPLMHSRSQPCRSSIFLSPLAQSFVIVNTMSVTNLLNDSFSTNCL